jgi:hypothetical protein
LPGYVQQACSAAEWDCCFTIQVFINVAVVTNLIPSTGVTLPFISAGGVFSCFVDAIVSALVLNISRNLKKNRNLQCKSEVQTNENTDIRRGTGGHIYPAIAIANELRRETSRLDNRICRQDIIRSKGVWFLLQGM